MLLTHARGWRIYAVPDECALSPRDGRFHSGCSLNNSSEHGAGRAPAASTFLDPRVCQFYSDQKFHWLTRDSRNSEKTFLHDDFSACIALVEVRCRIAIQSCFVRGLTDSEHRTAWEPEPSTNLFYFPCCLIVPFSAGSKILSVTRIFLPEAAKSLFVRPLFRLHHLCSGAVAGCFPGAS